MSRWGWAAALVGIIALGLGSRVFPVGQVWWDKYLGDALYAAMVYAGLRPVWPRARADRVAGAAGGIMIAIELLQTTGLPAAWLGSDWMAVRLGARLLGTTFGWGDLLAYAVGIGAMLGMDRLRGRLTMR